MLAEPHHRVLPVLQLPPLQTLPLSPRQKEVRVWTGVSLGYPRRLVRILVEGEQVHGEVYHYWRVDWDSTLADTTRYEALIRRRMRGTCTEFVVGAGYEACRARFAYTPRWAEILRDAEDAGLWTLPDESTLPHPSIMIDGWSLAVETRDGESYRAYGYASPRTDASPESARALRIAQAVGRLAALQVPSEVVLRYRGLLRVGPSLREFVACGTAIAWKVEGNLQVAGVEWSSRPRADTLVVGIQQRYVEVIGELTPEWLARRWNAGYPRVLEVERVDHVAPWAAEACAGAPRPRVPR